MTSNNSMKINVQVISTGSKGNAVFLNDEVLVDCGVPFKQLLEAGIVDKIKYVFLTHQHKDHVNLTTIKRLFEYKPTIRIIAPDYLKSIFVHCNWISFLNINNFFFAEIGQWYKIGAIQYTAVRLHHDVPNVAWKLFFQLPYSIYYKVLYATDTANMDGVKAMNYDLYLIESNYTKSNIVRRIKEKRANGQFCYEDRVIKTHLSKEQCDSFLADNMGEHSYFIYLHEHAEEIEESEE